ncbi:MAG: IS200/IS605 family transposase [Planctomycetia bacterium]|nr:IS200/IS605 family transposase [Planctomycetia bacterium]
MAHSFSNLLYHIIFGTKHRVPCIDPELMPRLHAYLGGIVHELDGKPLIINGTTDHVHLLVGLSTRSSIADALRVLKTNSSRWVHETWPARSAFGWQAGYAAFSVSHSQRSAVWKYIQNQAEHHRKLTFAEEYQQFLRKHGIEYDERYLWE